MAIIEGSLFEYRQLLKLKAPVSEIKKIFLKNKKAIFYLDRGIHTPLILAIRFKRLDVAKMLFEDFNADDFPDKYNKTAQDYVSEYYDRDDHPEMFEYMREWNLRNFLKHCKH